ncbi:DUF1858 domain-containing protein [Ihubacter sp. rT4E-8]|uniref:DUF1858 domain-containing protein n=1 Tax=unclassified Ihubacter TaxID=2633299 RepID=UPI0013799FED
MKITEGMKVCDILNMDDRLEEVFEKHGMLCLGCPGAASETLKEAAEGHGIDVLALLTALNTEIQE